MWTAPVLIIIATIAGLLTLWRDDIVAGKKKINEEETDEQKSERLEKELKEEKTKRLKVISSCFILLTLLFTLYQIHLTNESSEKANEEKLKQHSIDSLRYATDSIKHVLERRQDERAHKLIDSIRKVQIDAYLSQIIAGKSIDSIKAKSTSITQNLSKVDTAIKASIAKIDKSSDLAQNSFNHLFFESQRMMNLLDTNITANIRIPIWSDAIVNEFEKYINEKGYEGDDIDVTPDFPYWNEIMSFVDGMDIVCSFYIGESSKWKTSDYLASTIMLPSAQMRLSNKYSTEFIPGDEFNNREQRSGGWLYYQTEYDGRFRVQYYRPDKNLEFEAKDLELAIQWRDQKSLSILDYDKAKVLVMIRFPSLRKHVGLFNLEKCNLSIDFNFSRKRHSSDRIIRPLDVPRPKFAREFIIESLSLK